MAVFSRGLFVPWLACTLAWFMAAQRAPAQDAANYDIHEISLWGLDPTLEQANQLAQYASALPGVAETDRSRVSGSGKLTPIGLVAFYGDPQKDVEIDLRIQSGRFVGHWPPAQAKSGRLRWIELALAKKPGMNGRQAEVAPDHWFERARKLGSLWVRSKSRSERFLAYDSELALAVPIQLTGGPDAYRIVNLSTMPLHDIVVSVPSASGRRIGLLDLLPPGTGPVTAAPPAAAAPATDAQTAPAAQGEAPVAEPANPGVEVVMSGPLAADDAQLEQTKKTLRERLVGLGLKAREADLLLSLASDAIFNSEQLVVAFRLPGDEIEVRLPLVAYPAPAKTVRTALVVVRNIDPAIKDEVHVLIAQLGDLEYKQREAAEKRLLELGRLAVPVVKEALKSPDPEVVFRAERILLTQNEKIDGS